MKILFLGSLYRQDEERCILRKSKSGLQNQANTFQWALIKGLDSILMEPVDIINCLPVGTYPKHYTELILKTRKWNHKEKANDLDIGAINLPFFKQIIRSILCQKEIMEWIKKNRFQEEFHIIIYSLYLPFLYAIKNLPKNINVTLIVTDLPEYDDLTLKMSFIKKILRLFQNKMIYKLLNRIDSFVVLTRQMKERLCIGNRPYVVIEGVVDDERSVFVQNDSFNPSKKIILYTGSLAFRFGIMNLLDSFKLIENENYELWICGSGEAENEIIRRSQVDKRIKYYGYISKEEVYKLQQEATILVNPRTNEGEYTKYSFPSKTMEYLISGKPVIMYKLDGIPEEYDQYLFYVNNNEPKDLANKIVEILQKPQNELDDFGNKARNFVITHKSNKIQAQKIIDMLNQYT